jgi:hypothetical protein
LLSFHSALFLKEESNGRVVQVSKNTFIYGCAAMGTGILKNDAGKLFEALTGPEKTILEVRPPPA